MSRQASEKTTRDHREVNRLLKANRKLIVERQGYALRAKLVEVDFAEWKARIDKFLALMEGK